MKKQLNLTPAIHSEFQEIVDQAATLLAVPAGLIMRVVDSEIEVAFSSHTEGNPYSPGDKEHLIGSGLYCEHVISNRDMLLVPNALASESWKDNPDIKLNMISYLGYPIRLPSGEVFGTICVLDRKANAYDVTKIKLIERSS